MTYEELLKDQKMKFFRLNKMLDGVQHGFSGPDPYWDIPYPIRGKRNKWGRCYACRYKSHTGFGFANRLRAGVDTADGKFDFDFNDVWYDRRTALAAVDDVIAWLNEVARDPVRANTCLAREFPLDERMGIVPRFVAERYIPDFYSIGKELGKSKSAQFVKIFDSGYFWRKENAQVEGMTANKFFEYCRIAYIASEEKDDRLDRSLRKIRAFNEFHFGITPLRTTFSSNNGTTMMRFGLTSAKAVIMINGLNALVMNVISIPMQNSYISSNAIP